MAEQDSNEWTVSIDNAYINPVEITYEGFDKFDKCARALWEILRDEVEVDILDKLTDHDYHKFYKFLINNSKAYDQLLDAQIIIHK
jgi:hypothetical protein